MTAATTIARRNLEHVKALEREVRRLRRERDALDSARSRRRRPLHISETRTPSYA